MSPTPTEVRAGGSPMVLMRGGVPLSLLFDLVLGPCSEELLADELDQLPRQRAGD